MTQLRIIALCGPKYSGKDTAAKILFAQNERHNYFRRAPMAEGVKIIVNETFGIPFDVMEDPIAKEQPWGPDGIIPRWPMMDVANWMRDKYGGDVWARRHERIALEMAGWGCHVITDCRFPEEVEYIEKYGGAIIYVRREVAEEALSKAQAAGDAMAKNQSESHYEFLFRKAHYCVTNDGSIALLHGQVLGCVRKHYEHWRYWEGVEENIVHKIRTGGTVL